MKEYKTTSSMIVDVPQDLINELMPNEYDGAYQTCRSYVRYKDEWFFISTVNRRSSDDLYGWFSETIVWEWNPETKKRGKEILGFTSSKGSVVYHMMLLDQLSRTGTFCKEEEENE